MRHVGHILVLAYAAAIGLFQYLPGAATTQGIQQSGPWIAAFVVALLFALAALFKLGRGVVESWLPQGDDISLAEFDVPDLWVFGLFSAFVAINLVAHIVLAAMADAAGTVWYVAWICADALVLAVSYVVFKVTAKQQLQRRNGPRSVGRNVA